MQNPELDELIHELETRGDMSVADFDGVANALSFLLPNVFEGTGHLARNLGSADAALYIADVAFPNWAVHIRGRANDKDGHWRCTIREDDTRDDDAVLGAGRSPVLGQAILAAILRLAAHGAS